MSASGNTFVIFIEKIFLICWQKKHCVLPSVELMSVFFSDAVQFGDFSTWKHLSNLTMVAQS